MWLINRSPQLGTADAEIKIPSVEENPELKGSSLEAWSRSVYNHACYASCRGFILANFYPSGPFVCIFSKTFPVFFLCWLWLTPVLAWARRKMKVTPLIVTIGESSRVECSRNMNRLRTCVTAFSGFVFRNCGHSLGCCWKKKGDLWYNDLCGMDN